MAGRCQATAASGSPCSATPRPGRPYCLWHDDQAEEERREFSRKGGRQRSNQARARRALPTDPKDLGDVRRVLGRALVGLERGELDPARGSAMAAVARAMATVIEKGEIETRLAAVETAAGVERGRTA
jgi:hypothetical protein